MDMDGFSVIRRDTYEEAGLSFSSGNKTHLVLQEPGIEVTFDFMPKGSAGFFYVADNIGITEINFIIEGKIVLRDQGKIIILTNGDFFYQKGPSRYISFEVYSDLKMFYLNNSPDFGIYEQEISSLLSTLNQIQEADGYTLSHCNRVKGLCMGISYYIGFDQKKLDVLFYASQFHDVGNSKIPLDILLKPDKLSDAEFEIMKDHCQYTYDLICEHYGEEIASIACNHHERIDGTGYPRQLKGDELDITSRIISVADAYDAMITPRPYHAAISEDEAISELWRCAETQFDGRVIQGLVDYLSARKYHI